MRGGRTTSNRSHAPLPRHPFGRPLPVSAPAPEAPVASPEALSVGGALPPLEVADVADLGRDRPRVP